MTNFDHAKGYNIVAVSHIATKSTTVITEVNLIPTASHFEVPAPGGKQIPARSWGSPVDCKAIVLLVHGLGAHSGWFEAFARQLKVRRIFAVSFDQSGFGKRRTEPFRGYTQWIDDLVRVFDYLKETYPNKPIFILGNSMGGLLSLVAMQHTHPDGLVLTSPGFDGAPETFTMPYRALTIVRALLRPEAEVSLPYDQNLVTRDATARAWIDADTQGRFRRLPGKYLLQLRNLSNAVKAVSHTVNAPVLMITAGQDRVINQRVNINFFNKLTAPSKQHKNFPDAWHDLMFDPLVDEVADVVVQWIEQLAGERMSTGLKSND